MLRAILTDVDGTLYRQSPVRRAMLARLLRISASHPREGWRTLRGLAAYRDGQEALRHQPPSSDLAGDQIRFAMRKTGYGAAFLEECQARWMHTEALPAIAAAVYPGMRGFLEWSRAQGLLLAAVSDYQPRQKLEAMGVSGFFSVAVSAPDKEVGQFKPAPRGIETALALLGVAPADALYIGDRPGVDDAAARAAGVAAVLLTRNPARCRPPVIGAASWKDISEIVAALREAGFSSSVGL